MAYNPEKHNRRSMRFKGYDYSHPGFYYVTICTQDRLERFGLVSGGEMILSNSGEMVDAEWNRIPERYGHIVLDKHQTMPNHMHGILEIRCRGGVAPPSMNGDKPRGTETDEPNNRSPINTGRPGHTDINEGAETAPLQTTVPLVKV